VSAPEWGLAVLWMAGVAALVLLVLAAVALADRPTAFRRVPPHG